MEDVVDPTPPTPVGFHRRNDVLVFAKTARNHKSIGLSVYEFKIMYLKSTVRRSSGRCAAVGTIHHDQVRVNS